MSTQTIPQPAPGAAPERLATLVEHFHRQVGERGAAGALFFRSGSRYATITWADYGRAVERWVAYLIAEGVAEQEHVAIWSDNRPEWHIADAGILSARCRPVPVYLTLSAEQAGYVLGHSASRVVVVENDTLRDKVLAVRDRLPELRRIVVVGTQASAASGDLVVSWQSALQRGEAERERLGAEAGRRRAAVTLDDVATLIYTSGTTGPPKAVQLTHANVAAAIAALDEFVHTGPADRYISYLPLAHIAERLSTEFRSYRHGNAVYFLDGMEHLGERLREVRPTAFFAVPRVWEKMAAQVQNGVDALPQPRRALARWALRTGTRAVSGDHGIRPRESVAQRVADRLVLRRLRGQIGLDQASILASGAAPIAPEVLRFFGGIGYEILEVYGQTEDTGCTTMNRPGAARIGTVGPPLHGNEVRIAGDGEILVRGGVVFPGYYMEPEATRETLVDGWLHTGDLGELDADGYLRITGRKKDLIITAGGKNISPSNIEQLLEAHELVAHAVVIGDRRPFVVALLTLDPEHAPASSDALNQALAAHVAAVNRGLSHVEQVKRWAVLPRDFEVGDELTPTLKVKRAVVTEKYAGQIEDLYKR